MGSGGVTQFYEDQEVEVAMPGSGKVWKRDQTRRTWRKAKVLKMVQSREHGTLAFVRFPDGESAVFDAAHIRQPKSNRL
jgi:hypothetical protein